MTDIKLSICIPTFNRAPYLRSALECLAGANFSFSHEIVISDNASTDNTQEVVQGFIDRGLPITYLREPVNMGGGPNFTNALTYATGEYMVYQGDDDLLIPGGVEKVIAYLDANPDVTACQAPWYLHNEVEGVDLQKFYEVESDVKFDRQDFLGVFEYIFKGHIFPEIGIYRMSSVRSAYVPRYFCFWPFVYLAHFLDQGAVAFLKEPFYRFISVSKIAPTREQAGHEDAMTAWDMYRGGLEYFLHLGAQRGALSVTDEARAIYDKMCKIFVVTRMAVAIRLWVARNDFIRAYELYTRMTISGHGDHPDIEALRPHFPVMVGLQTLAYKINAVPAINRLMLNGMSDPGYITQLLRDLHLAPEIEVVSDADGHDPERLADTAILVTGPAEAEEYVARGYNPNFIFQEQDLTRFVLI